MSTNIDDKKKEEAKNLIAAMHSKMQDEFQRYKNIHYNPNTKGSNYEEVIGDMLRSYLGSKFNIHNRSQLIDVNMDYLGIFDRGSNEVDVVGTFKTAVPNLVLKIQDTELIPYDAVAFLVEVADTMRKGKLEEDLKKLQKILQLPLTQNRFGVSLTGQYNIQRPLRILFYIDNETAQDTRNSLLIQYCDIWDAVVVLSENKIILNMDLAISKALSPNQPTAVKILDWGGNAFVTLLLLILTTVPTPLSVNVIKTFINLDTFSKKP